MVQKVTGREGRQIKPGLRHSTTGKLCQTSSKLVPILNQGWIAKEEGWAPPFICRVTSNSHCSTAIRLRKLNRKAKNILHSLSLSYQPFIDWFSPLIATAYRDR